MSRLENDTRPAAPYPPVAAMPGSGRGRLAAGMLAVSLFGFVFLSAAVLAGATDALDRLVVLSLRNAVANDSTGALLAGEFMAEITTIGGKPVLGLLGLLVAGFLALLRRWRDLAFLGASLLGGLELSGFFKGLFGRVRPDLVAHMVSEDSLSFPSGHATYSAIAYLAFGILLWRVLPRGLARAYVAAAAALLVLLVGFSRVYLGVHYPSDVLAGWCLGTAWALGCWLALSRLWPGPVAAAAPDPVSPGVRSAAGREPADADRVG